MSETPGPTASGAVGMAEAGRRDWLRRRANPQLPASTDAAFRRLLNREILSSERRRVLASASAFISAMP